MAFNLPLVLIPLPAARRSGCCRLSARSSLAYSNVDSYAQTPRYSNASGPVLALSWSTTSSRSRSARGRDHAGDRLRPCVRSRDPDAHRLTGPKPAAARRVVDLDPRRLDPERIARLPGPGKVLEHRTAERTGKIRPSASRCPDRRARPRRARTSTASPPRRRYSASRARRPTRQGRSRRLRHSQSTRRAHRRRFRASSARRPPVDPPAGTGRIAVARLEVRAADPIAALRAHVHFGRAVVGHV